MLFYFTTWPVTSPKQLWTSSQMSPICIGIQLVEIFMYKTNDCYFLTPSDRLKAPVGLASNLTFYSIRGHKWTRSDDHFSITISDSLWFENVTTGLICIFDDDLFFISENISKTFIAPEAIEQPLSSLDSFSNGKLPSNLDDISMGVEHGLGSWLLPEKILPKWKVIEVLCKCSSVGQKNGDLKKISPLVHHTLSSHNTASMVS